MTLDNKPPLINPSDSPLVQIQFNVEWLPFLIGYIAQLENAYLFANDPDDATEYLTYIEVLQDIFMGAIDVP